MALPSDAFCTMRKESSCCGVRSQLAGSFGAGFSSTSVMLRFKICCNRTATGDASSRRGWRVSIGSTMRFGPVGLRQSGQQLQRRLHVQLATDLGGCGDDGGAVELQSGIQRRAIDLRGHLLEVGARRVGIEHNARAQDRRR